jgi:G6PDH family F420-dependent oxidoreductase
MRIGYFLACEEYQPHELLEQARLAEDAGFSFLWISDQFHPWNSQQGQSAFVWSMIGALAQECSLPVTTAVTCPIMRIHPAVIAQAAATSAVLLQGGFTLGLGTGEALNEHITGQVWPPEAERLDMLAEAVAVIRRLWSGQVVSHRGCHFRVDTARLFTLPDSPPPIFLSAFGPKATELAAHIADGFITTKPDKKGLARFRAAKGTDAPAQAGFKVAYAPTRDEGISEAHRLWPNERLPGEMAQVLPTPEHFEQASSLVTREMTEESIAAGPDRDEHLAAFEPYRDAGYDSVAVGNIGRYYREMIAFYGSDVLPVLQS